MKSITGYFLTAMLLWGVANAQESKELEESDEEMSNVQTFTPSKLLQKGQVDVQLFNNLYTQTKARDADRVLQDAGGRATFFRTFAQGLFGTSKSGRVNWGFDLVFSSVRYDSTNSAAIKVLALENDGVSTRNGLTAFGPKIKFSPLEKVPDFSIQSAVWLPIAEESEMGAWIDWNRLTSWTQIFYAQNLNSKWQLFYEADVLARFSMPASFYNNETLRGNIISFPASFFVNYFSSSKSTVYAMTQYASTHDLETMDFLWDYAQVGLGGKYQLTSSLQLELLFSHFFTAKNSGAGQTYNVGLRYIR